MEFDKILYSLKDNKKKIIIIALLFIVFLVSIFIISGFTNRYNDEKNLKKAFVSLGERVYQDIFYEGYKNEIKNYEMTGIKITMYDMFDAIESDYKDYFYNKKTKEPCDADDSYVIIYPKYPYSNKDYGLSFELICGY